MCAFNPLFPVHELSLPFHQLLPHSHGQVSFSHISWLCSLAWHPNPPLMWICARPLLLSPFLSLQPSHAISTSCLNQEHFSPNGLLTSSCPLLQSILCLQHHFDRVTLYSVSSGFLFLSTVRGSVSSDLFSESSLMWPSPVLENVMHFSWDGHSAVHLDITSFLPSLHLKLHSLILTVNSFIPYG